MQTIVKECYMNMEMYFFSLVDNDNLRY